MYSEQRVASGKIRETITKQREARTKQREVINDKDSEQQKGSELSTINNRANSVQRTVTDENQQGKASGEKIAEQCAWSNNNPRVANDDQRTSTSEQLEIP